MLPIPCPSTILCIVGLGLQPWSKHHSIFLDKLFVLRINGALLKHLQVPGLSGPRSVGSTSAAFPLPPQTDIDFFGLTTGEVWEQGRSGGNITFSPLTQYIIFFVLWYLHFLHFSQLLLFLPAAAQYFHIFITISKPIFFSQIWFFCKNQLRVTRTVSIILWIIPEGAACTLDQMEAGLILESYHLRPISLRSALWKNWVPQICLFYLHIDLCMFVWIKFTLYKYFFFHNNYKNHNHNHNNQNHNHNSHWQQYIICLDYMPCLVAFILS